MTKTTRHLLVGVMMTGLVGAGRPVVAAGADTPAMSRVRSNNPAIAALMSQAGEQSETFRGLIETINASDGIVYVEEGTCGHGVRACFVTVTTAGANRMLWVKVDTRKANLDLMASIGHELRHTIEVLGERTVTSSASMYMFYSRVGLYGTPSSFETTAAIDAGNAVGSEIRKYRARTQAN